MARYLAFRDGGKTDEKGISRYISKFLDGEVLDGLQVTQQGPLALGIAVASGDALIPSGNDYPYPVWNDASLNVSLATADGSNPRYDLIVGYVDLSVVSSTNPNNPNAFVIDNVTGTPAGSPVEPNNAAILAVIGSGNPYIILARVLVGAGVTTISNSNILDRRNMVSLGVASEESESGGWLTPSGSFSVSTGYNKGNREYDITSSVDLTGILSPGMKLKVARNTAPPTQCVDLESTSSHYASDTTISGITFTDDFTCEAWIKLESYTRGCIISRYNGTSGWVFEVLSTGQLQLYGANASAANFSLTQSYQSLPLNRWVHVAACLDMSTFTTAASPIYVDGSSVPVAVSRGGTNPTALVQAGDLQIGKDNTTNYFDGKVADVRLWDSIRTATQIRDNMNQQLVGSETNLVGYWKLNGNFNDSDSNANNLTGQNSAVATNADNPMQSIEYAEVVSLTSTIITVRTPIGYQIPNMTLNTPAYSINDGPFGWPMSANKKIGSVMRMANFTSTSTSDTDIDGMATTVTVPTGGADLRIVLKAEFIASTQAAGNGVNLKLAEGSTILDATSHTTPVSAYSEPATIVHEAFYAAGSHTFKGVIKQAAAGTVTYGCSVTAPGRLTVEIIN